MRYNNLRLTYLLTYLLPFSTQVHARDRQTDNTDDGHQHLKPRTMGAGAYTFCDCGILVTTVRIANLEFAAALDYSSMRPGIVSTATPIASRSINSPTRERLKTVLG